MKQVVIYGEAPSKKNSRVINFKLKRTFPSARYTAWHDDALRQLAKQREGFSSERCKIMLKFYHGDFIKRDSDNGVSSVFDTLVDAGYLTDDNWRVAYKHLVENEYEKNNARVEITFLNEDEYREILF